MKTKDKAKKYMLQGDQFVKVEAMVQEYIAKREAAEKARVDAHQALWKGIQKLVGVDIEDYALNREHRDQGVIFLEPAGCDCPIHRPGGLAGLFASGVKAGSLSDFMEKLTGKGQDGAEFPEGAKPH